MMTTHYEVELEGGTRGEIWLLNECPVESVEINTRFWEKCGKPKQAILELDGSRLFLKPG